MSFRDMRIDFQNKIIKKSICKSNAKFSDLNAKFSNDYYLYEKFFFYR